MKIKYFAVIVMLVSLILVGCEGGDDQVQKGGAYIGGSQGIVTNFEAFGEEEGDVYSIFDTETFPIEITLINKGEYKLQPGDVSVKLMGPAQSELEGISSWELKNADVIDKIADLNPEGGEETITFADEALFLTPTAGSIDRQWFANVEYKYVTELIIPEVCLKEDLKDKRVCEVKELKDFSVSGAPITVVSVNEDTAGKGIMALKIKISNVGGGDKVAKLDGEFGVRDVLGYSIDDPAWECKSRGKLNEARLTNGEAEILCKLKQALAEKTLSTKQVKLTFEYKYRDTIQETLRIKQSVE